MRRVTSSALLLFCFILLLSVTAPAYAMPAITCHCFTDRSFEPSRPAAADPYFLATTQNTFFAIVFNTDKKSVVMKKQRGASPDDLWIAYWVATKSGISPDSLLQAKQKNQPWKSVIASQRVSMKHLGTRFTKTLNSTSSSGDLAEAVVDELFLRHNLLADAELAAIRQIGVSNQELIIATVIAVKTRQSVRQVYSEVKNGSKSWGTLLTRGNVDIKNLSQEISSILGLRGAIGQQ